MAFCFFSAPFCVCQKLRGTVVSRPEAALKLRSRSERQHAGPRSVSEVQHELEGWPLCKDDTPPMWLKHDAQIEMCTKVSAKGFDFFPVEGLGCGSQDTLYPGSPFFLNAVRVIRSLI